MYEISTGTVPLARSDLGLTETLRGARKAVTTVEVEYIENILQDNSYKLPIFSVQMTFSHTK